MNENFIDSGVISNANSAAYVRSENEQQKQSSSVINEEEKIISELIEVLNGSHQDIVIMSEIAKTVHLLLKEGGIRRKQVICHPQLITPFLQLFNTDQHLTRILASLFHDLSTQSDGVELLLIVGVIPFLLQSLELSDNNVINFVMTTLRNCLITLSIQTAQDIQQHNGCIAFMSLLIDRHSHKLMNFAADCLLRLTMYNLTAQIYLQTSKLFLQELVILLDETHYDKLIITLVRIFPLLSSNSDTKSILIQLNIIPILERILQTKHEIRIQRHCLLTIRNLSDKMIHLEGFDSLIITLIDLLSNNNDIEMMTFIVGIMSNLSCENQSNKSLMIHHNAVQILIHTIVQVNNREEIIEPAICTLRHLTGKCQLASQARDFVRTSHGIRFLVKFLHTKENSNCWSVLKACIGLIRNLALSMSNLIILCENRTVHKLGILLVALETFPDRVELLVTTLLLICRQEDEKLRLNIYTQIIQSGCVSTLAKFASHENFGRIQEICKSILHDLNNYGQFEHQQIVKQAEKTRKIVQFLQID